MGTVERRQREKEQRINLILDAAERIFTDQGLADATMSDIAGEAELSKGLLYFYFKNKEDLYNALSQRGLRIVGKMMKRAVAKHKAGLDQMMAIGETYFAFCKQYPHYFDVIAYYETYVPETTEVARYVNAAEGEAAHVLQIAIDAIGAGIQDGSIRADLDPVQTALITWAQLHGVMQTALIKKHFIQENYGLDLDQLIRPAIELIRRSITT